MTTTSSKPPANAFVAFARHIYNPIGFSKGYNFALWFILCGALLGFVLARLMFLDFDGVLCPTDSSDGGAMPGQCYFYKKPGGKSGILLHLSAILPASLLVVLQFVPAIRHRAITVHRICGYIVLVLIVASSVGVFFIIVHTYKGIPDMQTPPAFASILFLVSKGTAFYHIKRLQIDQHRAWMLRAWAVAGYIITMRIISLAMANIVGSSPNRPYSTFPCAVIDYMFGHNETLVTTLHRPCMNFYSGQDPNQHTMVHADTTSGRPDELVAAYNATFSSGSWLALAIHCIMVEVYLRLTSSESERLRRVSHLRRLESGNEPLTNSK